MAPREWQLNIDQSLGVRLVFNGRGETLLSALLTAPMDISTKRDTHVHLHCETLRSVCVTDRMISFTTANDDSLLVHLSREQLQELIREIRRELADSWES